MADEWPASEIVRIAERLTTLARYSHGPTAESAAPQDEIACLRELLGCIWLYVDWKHVTKQLTTEQKELWADAVDASGESGPGKADRWWRDEYVEGRR